MSLGHNYARLVEPTGQMNTRVMGLCICADYFLSWVSRWEGEGTN